MIPVFQQFLVPVAPSRRNWFLTSLQFFIIQIFDCFSAKSCAE